jgi:hypothetical protein
MSKPIWRRRWSGWRRAFGSHARSAIRHCEELATKLQSNFALKRRSNPYLPSGDMDCFAPLAMTDDACTATSCLAAPLTGKVLRLLSNDLDASAQEIADLYCRCIELFFRWGQADP